MSSKKEKGTVGERIALDFLLQKGYAHIASNWRFLKAEIDLIVTKEEILVFVEVKTRSSLDYGNPEDFVSNRQQKLIINAAHEFILEQDRQEEARFDIVSILLKEDSSFEIEHLKGAFYPTL